MPRTTASAGRADRAGEVGVQPSCSRGPGWGAAALPPPPPAQLPDGRRGPEPGVAGETGSSAPCPTEMPLFLAAQRLSDKVHVALRAVRQDNRPLRTTGPSAASPPRPSRLPGCPGKGPNQALRPAHRGPAGGRGAGTLESRCPPSHCMLGRASADAPHPRAQSGPGSGGIWGPRPLRGGPVGTGRLLPVKMLLIGGRETSPAWTSTHGADSQPGTAEWTRAPWLHVSTLSTEGGGGTEPHRPSGPLESCVHSAPPGTEPDGETLGGVGHAARRAYLVLHPVQTGADGVAAAVLALLCGVKCRNQGACWQRGGHPDWVRGQGWGARWLGVEKSEPASCWQHFWARTSGGGRWGWGLGGESPALIHSSQPLDWGAGHRRTGTRPTTCCPCRPAPVGAAAPV